MAGLLIALGKAKPKDKMGRDIMGDEPDKPDKEEEEPADEEPTEEQLALADEVLKAVKDDDAEGLARSLKALVAECMTEY